MQELHLVGFTTDRRHLIFSSRQGAKSGSFLVPVDEDLLHAVEGLSADTAHNEDVDDDFDEEVVAPAADTRVDAKLSVREVQAQLRAGVAVEEIAARAEVDPGWVERFALPIRAEQQQVVSRAHDARMERPRAGQSALTLREAVSRSMAERDLTFTAESFASAWSSRLVGADLWSIEFTFSHRGRRRTVAWTFEAAEGRLTTSDRLASQIGFVAGADPRPSEGDEQPKTPRPAAKKKAAAKTTRPSTKKSAAKKKATSTKKATSKKTAARKSTAKKTGAKKTRTATPRKRAVSKKRVPTAKRVAAARKDATERLEKATAQRVAAAKKAAERKSAAAGKAARRRAAADEKQAARAARAEDTRRRAEEQAEAESSAEKDREAARAVAAAERQLAEERRAGADAASAATAAPDPEPEAEVEPEPVVREPVQAVTVEPEAVQSETAQPEDVEPETASTGDRPESPPVPRPAPRPRPVAAPAGSDVERRPDQAVVRLRAPQPSVPAEDPAARVAARRARAAERSVSTAQFRSGSAVQAASTPVNGAGAAIPEGVRRREPREEEPPAGSGDGRRPRSDGRRTRTRQLRAR